MKIYESELEYLKAEVKNCHKLLKTQVKLIDKLEMVMQSVKQDIETGLVIGDKSGMKYALTTSLRTLDKHLGIEV